MKGEGSGPGEVSGDAQRCSDTGFILKAEPTSWHVGFEGEDGSECQPTSDDTELVFLWLKANPEYALRGWCGGCPWVWGPTISSFPLHSPLAH